MKNTWLPLLTSIVLAMAVPAPVSADDLSDVAGKWSVRKTNDTGESYTQIIEIKKDKFTFKIVGAENKVALYAEGDIKAEKAGVFTALKFFNMKAGKSQAEAESVAEEREVIYRVDEDSLFIANNFDKERSQKPVMDLYKKDSK